MARAWASNKPLTFLGVAMIATLVAAVVGLVLDPRVITGAPAWLKPAKFAISVALYSFTLVWLLSFLPGRRRLVGVVSWMVTIALVVEMVLIIYAVIAGTASHFNTSTPAAAAIFSVMGTAIVVVWVATLILGIALLRHRHSDRAFLWSLRLGVLIGMIGMALAFLMTSPTSDQLAGPGPATACRRPERTASAWRTAARVCRSSAGARSAATCASPTSSGCTRCNCSRWWASPSRGGPRRRGGRGTGSLWCGRSASGTSGSCC
ncbi:hypothetical protein ACFQX7_40330 [Luedemannella flava]